MDISISKYECREHAGFPADGIRCPFCVMNRYEALKKRCEDLENDWHCMAKELRGSSNPDCASGFASCANELREALDNIA